MEIIAIILFVSIFILIMYGYPVALTLGGLSITYAFFFLDPSAFGALPPRIMGVISNYVLLSVPLFVFMGIMLEKSGLAESLLETVAILFGKMHGGLAFAVILVGTLLAASTGIVGATVVTMGLISLPTMLKRGYKPEIATGVIAASGTLGQIIPPSVVLVLLGSVLNVSVGKLFASSLIPGLVLVAFYIIFVFVVSKIKPEWMPPIPKEEIEKFRANNFYGKVWRAFALPLILIISVLGSIFLGIASPTEAAAVGAMGATILTLFEKKLNFSIIKSVCLETTHLTSMIFLILLGATTFSFVFRELGGDVFLVRLIQDANMTPLAFLFLVMLIVFIAGFFIDFIEIIFIIVPVVAPVFQKMGVDLIWIGVLLGLNLQTSFLTPPFGFSLFYLKGVAPSSVTTAQIYRGIIPFILIQLIVLGIYIFMPSLLIIP
ncbi:MAG: TRAP transporter large permease subunit [Saprospiraceae bacterium]|jgi:tripartite ATP-independent transporter DctM subunit|nr:TRAP transporter large permease subunit [Saprospiraceae bacterium]